MTLCLKAFKLTETGVCVLHRECMKVDIYSENICHCNRENKYLKIDLQVLLPLLPKLINKFNVILHRPSELS